MYNKLFAKIVDSSIWLEPDQTRIVWFMFIALMNEDGFVQFASIANVAYRARISHRKAAEALKILESPDPNSADPDNEGRRIEKVPGGWMVLNAHKYRDLVTREMVREQTRERVARHRAKVKGVTQSNADVTQRNGKVTQSDSDTDTETKKNTEARRVSRPPVNVEDWLKELESNQTYAKIDVRREYGKCCAWCKVRGAQPTQRRFINWLNKAEIPLPTKHAARVDYKRNHAPPAREPTEEEFEKHREIARKAAEELRQKLRPVA